MKNLKSKKKVFVLFFAILIVLYVLIEYCSYKFGMDFLIEKYGETSIVYESGHCIVFAEKNDTKDCISVKSIKYSIIPVLEKKNTISYNPEMAYVSDYKQTYFGYLFQKCITEDIINNPAEASQGRVSWFDKRTMLPHFTVTEIEFQSEKNVGFIEIEKLEIDYE